MCVKDRPEILERIPRLSDEQLEEVRRYEGPTPTTRASWARLASSSTSASRSRSIRTLPAGEVTRQIADMDIDQALAVRDYEKERANRVSVMRAVEKRLEAIEQEKAQQNGDGQKSDNRGEAEKAQQG